MSACTLTEGLVRGRGVRFRAYDYRDGDPISGGFLAMYLPRQGVYTADHRLIRYTASQYYSGALGVNDTRTLMDEMYGAAPVRTQNNHPDLVPVNNGVFYYGTKPLDITINGKAFRFEPKSLNPFDPHLILTAKARVNYVDDPEPVVITMPDGEDWELTVWIEDLFDYDGGEGLADLVWEIIGATLRPYVSWDKAAWFYATKGANGKSTLCAFIRNLIGSKACANIRLEDFSGQFTLYPLTRSQAILSDESAVGGFIDNIAGKMDSPEPLIVDYDLKAYMNPTYKGSDPDKVAMPYFRAAHQRGIQRVTTN